MLWRIALMFLLIKYVLLDCSQSKKNTYFLCPTAILGHDLEIGLSAQTARETP